jgi:hypothetical protein
LVYYTKYSDVSKNALVDATNNAGFGIRPFDSVSLVAEPEAAALAVIVIVY